MSQIPAPELSALEQYLFIDNRTSYPLDFFFRLDFDGQLSESDVSRAYRQALQHHPLLRSVVSAGGRRLKWTLCDREPSVQALPADATDERRQPPAIDLTTEPGSRLYLSAGTRKTTLLFQFHHSATDGLGALGFVRDVLLAYGERDLLQPSAVKRDIERLADRHRCGYQSASLFQRIKKQLYAIYISKDFLGCTVSPLVAHAPQTGLPRTRDDRFRQISHRLTVDETEALKKAASQQNVSANTWLVRDAFVAMDKTRRKSADYRPEEYIRIAVPGSLRSPPDNKGLPAANFFSMTFPARNAMQIGDQQTMLATVHQEVRAARKDYYFATFILALKLMCRIPDGLKRMLNKNQCQSTLLLTNVGPVLAEFSDPHSSMHTLPEGAVLRNVELIAPMRPYQTIAIATLEFAGQQNITLSYDPRVHTDADADSILQTYIDQLKSSLETAASGHQGAGSFASFS